MKKTLFLLLVCVAVSFLSACSSEDPHSNPPLITKQITLNLTEAGTLPNKIGSSKKDHITNLKIIGKINGTDLRFIREMAGGDAYGSSTHGNLSVLDLSEARIVEGGDTYYYGSIYGSDDLYTSNDIIGECTFYKCKSLTSVNIPSSVTEIGEDAFKHCNSLKSIYVFAEDVPSTDYGAFDGCDSKNCTVYVPKGTYDAYWLSEFGYFENIVEFDATSIHNTLATPEAQETARYAVNGQRLTAPIKGINLVKYSDGTVKKEFVK